GLSMCARDHNRSSPPQKMIADRFRKGTVPDLSIENFLEFDIATRNGVADHHQVKIGSDVLGAVALQRDDSLLHEEVAHRRLDVLTRAPHVVSAAFQERGKRGHRRATDANQMYSLGVHAVTAASSMMSAGRGEVRTRARTPNGSVNVGP